MTWETFWWLVGGIACGLGVAFVAFIIFWLWVARSINF